MYDAATGHMCFSEALAYLKRGLPIARGPWPAGVHLVRIDKMFFRSRPLDPKQLISYELSSIDVLAEDWFAPVPADTPQQESP